MRRNESSLFQGRDSRVYAISLRNGRPVNLHPFLFFLFVLDTSPFSLFVSLSVSHRICPSLSRSFVLRQCERYATIWEFELARVVNCRGGENYSPAPRYCFADIKSEGKRNKIGETL